MVLPLQNFRADSEPIAPSVLQPASIGVLDHYGHPLIVDHAGTRTVERPHMILRHTASVFAIAVRDYLPAGGRRIGPAE